MNTTQPGDDAHPGDGKCADAHGQCTLQAAVQEANALNADVTINVPAGAYKPDSVMMGHRLGIRASGVVHIVGAGADRTFIQGNGRPVVAIAQGSTVDMEKIAIQNGSGSGNTGGGITNDGTLTLGDSAVAGNLAQDADGGGILNRGSAMLINVTVENNNASAHFHRPGGFGGGVFNAGSMDIQGSTLRGNHAGLSGGAVHNEGSLSIENSTITDNAVFLDDHCCSPHGGAGVRSNSRLLLTIRSSQISGNSTTGDGGGINLVSGKALIVDSTITGNTAERGGGVYGSAFDSIELQNTSIDGNQAVPGEPFDEVKPEGGGIFVQSLTNLEPTSRTSQDINLRGSSVINNTPKDCNKPLTQADSASSDSDGTCIPGESSVIVTLSPTSTPKAETPTPALAVSPTP